MKNANDNRATLAAKSAAHARPMVVEGEAAVELYVEEIARNMTELNKQADLLSDLCAETKKLLRDVE